MSVTFSRFTIKNVHIHLWIPKSVLHTDSLSPVQPRSKHAEIQNILLAVKSHVKLQLGKQKVTLSGMSQNLERG